MCSLAQVDKTHNLIDSSIETSREFKWMNNDETKNSVQDVSVIEKKKIDSSLYWIEWEFNTAHKTMTP